MGASETKVNQSTVVGPGHRAHKATKPEDTTVSLSKRKNILKKKRGKFGTPPGEVRVVYDTAIRRK